MSISTVLAHNRSHCDAISYFCYFKKNLKVQQFYCCCSLNYIPYVYKVQLYLRLF